MIRILLLLLTVALVKGDADFSELTDPGHEIIKIEGLHTDRGRAKRFIHFNTNQVDIFDQSCSLPNDKIGICRKLRHCPLDSFKKNNIIFAEVACVLKGNSLGVCCPKTEVIEGIRALAGNLPAMASINESPIIGLRLNEAENRGCGMSVHTQAKVISTREAISREWPWMASVTPTGEDQHCGGVLITDSHVLTAAHCTRNYEASELLVRLGEYDLQRTNDTRSFTFKVVEKIDHPEFEVATYRNDISILKLHRPAVFNTYIWPICLPPAELNLTDEVGTVVGWGSQSYGGPTSDVLLEVSIPIWEHQKCVSSYVEAVFNENVCAGAAGKDACQYDSGGPLMYQMVSGRWIVVGVVSRGLGCGDPNHPGIYTRTDKYLDWILENTYY